MLKLQMQLQSLGHLYIKENMTDLKNYIEKIIIENTKYLRTYSGKVFNDVDDEKKGRIKCTILELGWDDEAKAVWCSPNDKNSLITPQKDDWVRVRFMNGDINRAYYTGIMNEMADMLPAEYESKDSQIIFEAHDGTHIKYDETAKEFIFEDSNGNKTLFSQEGFTVEDTNGNKDIFDSNGIKREDANGNVIEMKSGSIDLTGTLINLLNATEPFVLGNVLDTWILNTLLIIFNAHTHSGVQAGGSSTSTPSSPLTAPTNYLSTDIKGS